jgi:hypothetical protein
MRRVWMTMLTACAADHRREDFWLSERLNATIRRSARAHMAGCS